jgi:hypothetical protein
MTLTSIAPNQIAEVPSEPSQTTGNNMQPGGEVSPVIEATEIVAGHMALSREVENPTQSNILPSPVAPEVPITTSYNGAEQSSPQVIERRVVRIGRGGALLPTLRSTKNNNYRPEVTRRLLRSGARIVH